MRDCIYTNYSFAWNAYPMLVITVIEILLGKGYIYIQDIILASYRSSESIIVRDRNTEGAGTREGLEDHLSDIYEKTHRPGQTSRHASALLITCEDRDVVPLPAELHTSTVKRYRDKRKCRI